MLDLDNKTKELGMTDEEIEYLDEVNLTNVNRLSLCKLSIKKKTTI